RAELPALLHLDLRPAAARARHRAALPRVGLPLDHGNRAPRLRRLPDRERGGRHPEQRALDRDPGLELSRVPPAPAGDQGEGGALTAASRTSSWMRRAPSVTD